jgi:hypothetical protein
MEKRGNQKGQKINRDVKRGSHSRKRDFSIDMWNDILAQHNAESEKSLTDGIAEFRSLLERK